MASLLKLSFVDHDDEKSNVAFNMPDVNAGNFTAQDTAMDTVRNAVEGVLITNLAKEERVFEVVDTGAGLPANGFAQRETKWLVSYQDDVTGKKSTRELPGADLALLVSNEQVMEIASGAGQTLVTALEAEIISDEGNAITVLKITHVGRNI